jgi:hypothetical protein
MVVHPDHALLFNWNAALDEDHLGKGIYGAGADGGSVRFIRPSALARWS